MIVIPKIETAALSNPPNSVSDIVVFACTMLDASLPTVYLSFGLSDVTAYSTFSNEVPLCPKRVLFRLSDVLQPFSL